ncbi:uncharacterized protein K444DRAFT_417692 [Hyaloscypha bicolor E]|uniref:Uncharacterized protein n=1 Tax=Hyaloscypha bicolor E TaxID=1095630 RepID=A0A2J6T780_9HELO|nr:uncharacterized protein K444DRAFT_417692 [Hyaloscypha bicolor E]PMD58879.1 hypothetical protein K444DRAFT_417692 [Hyaloscypha bicolor E]
MLNLGSSQPHRTPAPIAPRSLAISPDIGNFVFDENVFQDGEFGTQMPLQVNFNDIDDIFTNMVDGSATHTLAQPSGESNQEAPTPPIASGSLINIGMNYLIQPSAIARAFCTHLGCFAFFKRDSDRIRHNTSVHGVNQGRHFCPIAGCAKSQGMGIGYCRWDKVKEHLWKKHANLGHVKGRV